MTTLTYGDLPGVQATVRGGGIVDVTVGYAQKIVIFGRGDPVDGTASYNTVESVQTPADADTLFGEGSRLADGLRGALANEANREFLYGVMPTETTVSAEPVTGGSGTLLNAPIVEDLSTVSVTATVDGTTMTPAFVHESPPPAPTDAGVVNINPLTGETTSSGTADYEVDYAFLDWQSALDSADTVLRHNEVGVYATLSDSEIVAQALSDKLDELRPTYKLLRGVSGAQPNATNAAGEPIIDTAAYTDTLDDDALFLAGPVRLDNTTDTRTVIGGIAGVMGGNDITDPIYGDTIAHYGSLIQTITPAEEGEVAEDETPGTGLRGKQVMPVRDDGSDGGSGLTLEDSLSTSTLTDWTRDYHNRRVVDQILITAREIGETLRGRRLRDPILENTEQEIVDVLAEYATDGLIAQNSTPGTETGTASPTTVGDEEDQTYTATITRTGTDEVSIGIYFAPIGVGKRIKETIFVTRNGTQTDSATP